MKSNEQNDEAVTVGCTDIFDCIQAQIRLLCTSLGCRVESGQSVAVGARQPNALEHACERLVRVRQQEK